MLRASLKKIKSARRPPRALILAGGIVLVVAVIFTVVGGDANKDKPSELILKTSAVSYRLEAVSTPERQIKGLSGRADLPADTGMIFVYTEEAERCFWMKDMRFNIDIIWVSAEKRVTRIVGNLSPGTYPKSFCADARYVIELDAGEAARGGLRRGDALDF